DPAKIVFIRKNFVLHWQEHAGRIDEVNERKRTFKCDPLRANHLLGGRRKKRAGFHGCVVSDDHARNALDVTDAGHNSRRRDFSPLLVHFVRRPEPNLEKWRVLIQQMTKTFADWQASHLALTLVTGFAAAFAQHRLLLSNRRAMRAQDFTSVRSRHMPVPRLICDTERIKPTQD